MDRRVLDLISTKFLTKKLSTEVELENLINNNLKDSLAVVSDEIMLKVRELREISSDISTWENIVTQLTKSKENIVAGAKRSSVVGGYLKNPVDKPYACK